MISFVAEFAQILFPCKNCFIFVAKVVQFRLLRHLPLQSLTELEATKQRNKRYPNSTNTKRVCDLWAIIQLSEWKDHVSHVSCCSVMYCFEFVLVGLVIGEGGSGGWGNFVLET